MILLLHMYKVYIQILKALFIMILLILSVVVSSLRHIGGVIWLKAGRIEVGKIIKQG